jgi:uncharacterized damage-inducible protein DinB
MSLAPLIAKQFRDVYYGKNWTFVNLKDTLADVTWQEATQQVYSCNTIVTLVYHIGYYITEALKVFEGEPLMAKDEYSFSHPSINSQEDWDNLLNKFWMEADKFASLLEQKPDSWFYETFTDEKYGTCYRNMAGMIEHTHYHMGQIVIIKKVLRQMN